MRSGGGAFTGGPTAQARVQQGRWQVRLVKRADVGAGRDDLVDLVEGIAYSQRMVTLLIDGLRYAAELQRSS